MVVTAPTTTPSLAVIYDSLLQGRAAHSSTGGPPLDTQAVKQQASHGQAAGDTLAPKVNILA
jgi:hypothetical protein